MPEKSQSEDDVAAIEQLGESYAELLRELNKVIYGQTEVMEKILTEAFSGLMAVFVAHSKVSLFAEVAICSPTLIAVFRLPASAFPVPARSRAVP